VIDIVDSSTRSRIMAVIKGRNTKPELLIRSLLHKNGFRFPLHVKDLPGKPDIVLPRYGSVIFVHSCFNMAIKTVSFSGCQRHTQNSGRPKLSETSPMIPRLSNFC
jgi:DNA mismatch endonuclease Vsr